MKKIPYLMLAAAMLFVLASCDKIMESAVKKQVSGTRVEMMTDGKLHVVLVGSGGPMPNTERQSVSTAVIAGGEFILVDTGGGAARNANLQKLPIGNLSAVFLTHFHSDHIADLGEVNMFSWVQGNRKQRLEVFGPEGVDKVVRGSPWPMNRTPCTARLIMVKQWLLHQGQSCSPKPSSSKTLIKLSSFLTGTALKPMPFWSTIFPPSRRWDTVLNTRDRWW